MSTWSLIFKTIAVLVILCVLSFPLFAGYQFPEEEDISIQINSISKKSINKDKLTFLVWNIYKGSNKPFKKEFHLLSKNKDVLILQEAYLNKSMKDLFSDLAEFEFHIANAWIDGSGNLSGVSTASLFSPIRKEWQRSHYLEPVSKTAKMTLFTEYKIEGRDETLLVVNIHGINFVRAYKLRHMLDQAAKLVKKHQGPVVFAGDFNTWTQTKINNLYKVMQKIGMTEVKFEKDCRITTGKKKIDYVWIKNLTLISSNSVCDGKGSDHSAMEFEVLL